MEVEEVNKTVQNFNLENELGKIKIPMPFIELMKNTSYKESARRKSYDFYWISLG